MFTTIGVCASAMSRKVFASIGPLIGALFIGGANRLCAIDGGASPSREVITMPMAIDATEMRVA